ncbi:hypothetical protein ACWDZ4_21660 [Streptomyces sp. NPDC003016]
MSTPEDCHTSPSTCDFKLAEAQCYPSRFLVGAAELQIVSVLRDHVEQFFAHAVDLLTGSTALLLDGQRNEEAQEVGKAGAKS